MTISNANKKPEKNKPKMPKTSQAKIKSMSPEKKPGKLKEDDGLLVEAARKIESGAKSIGEKTVDAVEKVTDQTTEIAELAYDTIKKQVSVTYDTSTKTLTDVSKKAGKYIKKYENTIEMKKLSHDKDKKMQGFGNHIYNLYKVNPKDVSQWLAEGKSQEFLKELEILHKDIIKLGRQIKRKI